MARRHTLNTKRHRRDLSGRCKLLPEARALLRPAHMATLPRAKPQMATSMRPPTAMSTRTPGAAGSKLRELRNLPQATRELIRLLPRGGAGKKRAAPHRLSVGAAEVVGNPGRTAHVVRQAAVVAAVGA